MTSHRGEPVLISKDDLRDLLNLAALSPDLDLEDVDQLRRLAPGAGIEPDSVTPYEHKCAYGHTFAAYSKRCTHCGRLPQPKDQP